MRSICSAADIVALTNEWGFLPFFENGIPGFSVEELTPGELWFASDVDGPWEWKGPVIRASGCAYGKFFGGKAVFISREWFLDFANYRRDGYDFDSRCDEGSAPYRDRELYEILEANGDLLSKELKRLWSFGDKQKKGFDAILTHLQMQGYVVTTDFEYQTDKHGKPYGWGVARYATPERFFGPEFRQQVYRREPAESRERILTHLAALLPQASEKQLAKLIG